LRTDDAALVQFLRERASGCEDAGRVRELVSDLGHENFDRREQAHQRLVRLDWAAWRELSRRSADADLERRRRVEKCLRVIERNTPRDAPLHVVRLLGARAPAGATEALLAYLPCAPDEEVEEAVYYALREIWQVTGKVPPALVEALGDAVPARRAVAACLLGKDATAEVRKRVRERLADGDALVRLRAAQGLLACGDLAGLGTLVGLLEAAPRDVAWQAEELLRYLGGDSSPEVVLGRAGVAQRKACAAAWRAGLAGKGRTADPEAARRSGRRPGLLLTFEDPPEGKGDGEKAEKPRRAADWRGKVWLCGCDGQPRAEAMTFEQFADERMPLLSLRGLVCNSESRMVRLFWPGKDVFDFPDWVHTYVETTGAPCYHVVAHLGDGGRIFDIEGRGGALDRVVEQDGAGRTAWESVYERPVSAYLICRLVRFGFERVGDGNLASARGRVGLLKHRDRLVRQLAAHLLKGMTDDPSVVRALGDALGDSQEEVRREAVRSLEGLGERSQRFPGWSACWKTRTCRAMPLLCCGSAGSGLLKPPWPPTGKLGARPRRTVGLRPPGWLPFRSKARTPAFTG
jgi:HEAT repeat protein